MNILHAYTLKTLRRNRRRTVVTIIGVILSCALLCGTLILFASFWDMGVRSAIATGGNRHVEFDNVPCGKASYLLENTDTRAGMLSRDMGFAAVPKLTNPYKPYIHLVEYDSAMLKNQPLRLVSGRLPRKAGEIVLSQQMMTDKAGSFRVGDTITLTVGQRVYDGKALTAQVPAQEGERLQASGTETCRITGIIRQPAFESETSPGYLAVAWLEPSALSQNDRVDVSLLVRHPLSVYSDAPKMAEAAGLTVSDSAEDASASHIRYNTSLLLWLGARSGTEYGATYTRSMLVMLAILLAIVIIGSVTVITNSFAISVSERKKQFGMLTSVGATARQLRQSVRFEALMIGLAGIPLGILGGVGGMAVTIAIAGRLLSSILNNMEPMRLSVSPFVLLATVLFASLTIAVSAAVPARRAAKASPIEAIRQTDEFAAPSRRRLRTGKLTRRLFGFEGELALKNLKRSRKKYRATVFSLFISIVMFLSFSSFMMYSLREAGTQAPPKYDIVVDLEGSNRIDYGPFIRAAAALPRVGSSRTERYIDGVYRTDASGLSDGLRAGSGLLGRLHLEDETEPGRYDVPVVITALGKSAFDELAKSLGQDPADYENTATPKGIFVNHNYTILYNEKTQKSDRLKYDLLTVKAGGAIPVTGQKTAQTDHPGSFPITVGAVDPNVSEEDMPSISETVYVSDDVFDSLATKFGPGSVENRTVFGIHSRSITGAAALTAQLKKLYTQTNGGAMSYYSAAENSKKSLMLVLLIDLFCYGFIALITLIGVTNIVNTIQTNIRLRRREFAVLESVGLTPKGLGRMLRLESLFYGIKALAYGLPVSVLICWLFYRQFVSGINRTFAFTLPWGVFIGCILGVFAIISGTMLYAVKKSKTAHIIDAIREENL